MASQSEELLDYAESKGAHGINVAGICCTANEVLMRHGLPIVGNFLQQELAILTGAVEVMVIDVQCVMPSLSQVTKCFHTKLVSHLRDCPHRRGRADRLQRAERLRAGFQPDPQSHRQL